MNKNLNTRIFFYVKQLSLTKIELLNASSTIAINNIARRHPRYQKIVNEWR